MKKVFLSILLSLFLFSGCVTVNRVVPNVEDEITALAARIDKLEKKSVLGLAEGAAANFYPCRGIDGDTSGTLDHIDGTGLLDNDVAFVVAQDDASFGDIFMVYVLDADSNETEVIPFIVSPENNAGTKRWILVASGSAPEYAVTSTPYTLSTAQVRSGYILQTVQGIINLPDAAAVGFGSMVCIMVRDSSENCTVNPDDSDKIYLAGTGPMDIGDSIINSGSATAGDFVCLIATTDVDGSGTDGWWMAGYTGTWSDNS